MISQEDIINRVIATNSNLKASEVKDLIRVLYHYIRDNTENEEKEAVELPYIGYLYRRLNTYSEKEKVNNPVFDKKYLRSIYFYDSGIKNLYVEKNMLKQKYNVTTKEELSEVLDNPPLKNK